jgi:hypothetical protein
VVETTDLVDGVKGIWESLESLVLCVVARCIIAVVREDLSMMLVSGGNNQNKESEYLVFQAVVHQHLVKLSCEPVTCVRLKQQRVLVLISDIQRELTTGTSTISSKKDNMCPSCCRCTVQATNAQWLGEVYASVAKWT